MLLFTKAYHIARINSRGTRGIFEQWPKSDLGARIFQSAARARPHFNGPSNAHGDAHTHTHKQRRPPGSVPRHARASEKFNSRVWRRRPRKTHSTDSTSAAGALLPMIKIHRILHRFASVGFQTEPGSFVWIKTNSHSLLCGYLEYASFFLFHIPTKHVFVYFGALHGRFKTRFVHILYLQFRAGHFILFLVVYF
jgi:hypothetical protein